MRRVLAIEEIDDLDERVAKTLELHQHPFFKALAELRGAMSEPLAGYGKFEGLAGADKTDPK